MTRTALITASFLAIAAVALKLVNLPLWENFGLFGALAIFCGCFLRGPVAWLLPVAALVFSDIVGNYLNGTYLGLYAAPAMLFNYAGLAAMGLIGMLLRNRQSVAGAAVAAIAGSAAFFLLSNFGCWLDPRMGYAPTPAGLFNCYVAAIPFARGTFFGDLVLTPVVFAAFYAFGAANSMRTAPVQATTDQ